jgi:hypothetical protein
MSASGTMWARAGETLVVIAAIAANNPAIDLEPELEWARDTMASVDRAIRRHHWSRPRSAGFSRLRPEA